jgi:sugar lactone lactonase YvrE
VYVDDNQTVYVADKLNHRIVGWKSGAVNGQIVAGGNEVNLLNNPTDVIVDKEGNNLIICDSGNRRVVRYPLKNGTGGQTIISNIDCSRLTMDNHGYLYVSDSEKDEVGRWKMNDSCGILVAGGNERGNGSHQLSLPTSVCVDEDHSVYVSDRNNHRVMKWMEDAKEGVVVAGGQGEGNDLTQLACPEGVVVDHFGTVYVADYNNHRIIGWSKGATQGNIVVGGNGKGAQANQLHYPCGLSFDRKGNLYVADWNNHRVQRFDIERS